jgi:hypothetical protein
MRNFSVALILATMFTSSVFGQLAAAPEGGVFPNGAFHYMIPGGVPVLQWGGALPGGMHFPVSQIYPLSYPMVPVPIPPLTGSTSDRISPMPDSEDKTSQMR